MFSPDALEALFKMQVYSSSNEGDIREVMVVMNVTFYGGAANTNFLIQSHRETSANVTLQLETSDMSRSSMHLSMK